MPTNNDIGKFDKYLSGRYGEIYDYSPIIDSTGDFQQLSGIDVCIRAIRNLLLTPLGQYPFDPAYGSLLYKKLFEFSDSVTTSEIIFEVKTRIKQFEDRITVQDVKLVWFEGMKGCQVDVYIDRNGVGGKVSVTLDSNQYSMFGLEDKVTGQMK